MSPPQSAAALVNELLHGSGRLAARQSVTLHPLPANPERRDQATLQRFLAVDRAKTLALVITGPNLTDLRLRSELFSTAYPDLACPVFAHGAVEDRDVLVAEYFDGIEATKILGDAPSGPDRLLSVLRMVAQRFEQAVEPSTPAAARDEVRELCARVLQLDYWTTADRAFLTGVVFPYAEEHLVDRNPRRRVTNGDFILQNILLGADGAVRVVDYEQATRTHLFAEDWLRFTYWDALPGDIRQFALAQAEERMSVHLHLALKQLVSEAAVNLPQKAQTDARHWCTKIRRMLEQETNELKQAMLWPATIPTSEPAVVRVQLFWMTDEGWAAERSIFLDAEEGTTCRLVFRIPPGPACHALRFDPGEGPGALVIRSVTVIQTGEKRKVVWSGTTAAELRRLEPGGDAVIDPASDPFKVVSVGADPRLYLNAVGAPAGIGLEVEIVATYITAPGDQIEALRSAVIRLQSAATAAAESAGAIAGLKGELDRLRLKDEILQTTVAREKEVYSASLAEIRDLSTGQWRAVAERLDRSRDELAHLRAEVGKIDVRHTRHQETLEALARDFATGMETLKTDGERTRQEGAERQKLETEQRRVLAVLAATRASLEAAEKQLMLNREYLTGHAATIDGLEQALIRRDAELGESRQEQRSLALNVQHIQDQLGRLAQELAAAREQSAVLHALQEKMTREKDILIATLEAERQTRQRQEDSFIWRVTTPLRRFSSWFLRLLN